MAEITKWIRMQFYKERSEKTHTKICIQHKRVARKREKVACERLTNTQGGGEQLLGAGP